MINTSNSRNRFFKQNQENEREGDKKCCVFTICYLFIFVSPCEIIYLSWMFMKQCSHCQHHLCNQFWYWMLRKQSLKNKICRTAYYSNANCFQSSLLVAGAILTFFLKIHLWFTPEDCIKYSIIAIS